MDNNAEPEDQAAVIMLVQQYAARFGITFSSSLMDDAIHSQRLLRLMADAISGKRGAVSDQDVTSA